MRENAMQDGRWNSRAPGRLARGKFASRDSVLDSSYENSNGGNNNANGNRICQQHPAVTKQMKKE